MPKRSSTAPLTRRALRRELINAINALDLPRVTEIVTSDPSIVNAPNSHRNVPLTEAISTGRLDLVKVLIEHGADPHHRNHGGSGLLDIAAFSGRPEIAKHLVSLGAEANVHHAAAIGDITLLKRLLTKDPSIVGPLHAAARAGQVGSVEYLLSIGASVHATHHFGHTPLAKVAECRVPEVRLQIARLLLSHGADPDSLAGHHGGTVLHRAIMAGDDTLAQLLLENGADPNRQDFSGKSALHHAVEKNRKLVELVLNYSPDLSVASRSGETPLTYALRLKKTAIVKMLADVQGTDPGH